MEQLRGNELIEGELVKVKRKHLIKTISITARGQSGTAEFIMPNTAKKICGVKIVSSKRTTEILLNFRRFGAAEPGTYNEAFVKSLGNTELIQSIDTQFTVTAGTNEKIYYAQPVRLGKVKFYVGGFEGGFELLSSTISVDHDESGSSENYHLWGSVEANLGSTLVQIVKDPAS